MRNLFQGWALVGTAAAIIVLVLAATAFMAGTDTAGVRLIIRITARTSLLLFGLAFAASSLVRLWPNAFTRWQIKNRRYLGVSFAASHAMHLAAILTFYFLDPVAFAKQVQIGTVIGGGLGYLLVAAMTATSFDRTAAWLGPRPWRILHLTGSFYVWLIFASSFLGHALADASYWPLFAYAALVMLARIAAAVSKRWSPATV